MPANSQINSTVSIASFECVLSNLTAVVQANQRSDTIFQLHEPLYFTVTVEFSGSGAIALLSLAPLIQVDFWAKSWRDREELRLGTITISTEAKQPVYTPVLLLPNGLQALGISSDQAYSIAALVRVGASGFPALMIGTIQGLLIQIY